MPARKFFNDVPYYHVNVLVQELEFNLHIKSASLVWRR
jgi:hypothetical protein